MGTEPDIVYDRRRFPRPLVGLLVLTAFVVVAAITFSGVSRTLLAPGGSRISAVFADTALLAPGSPVREHGVDVGTVSAISLNPGGHSSTVTMSITDAHAVPFHGNATAQVAWRTVLGANYAVNVDPGSAASGDLAGEVIPQDHTSGQVEIDQILTSLQQSDRQGLRVTIDQLPVAIAGKHTVPNAVDALGADSPSLTAGLKAVKGEDSGDLVRLVNNATAVMSVLREPIPTLGDVVSGGGAVLGITAARQADIQQTISLAAGALPQIELTAQRLDQTLALANPVLNKLEPVVGQVKPTVAVLNPTVADANTLVGEAERLLTSLRPTAAALRLAAHQANPLLAQLTPSIDETATEILPDLAKVYKASGRATYEMIGPTAAALDAASAALDGTSHIVTLTPGAGTHVLDSLPCQSNLGGSTSTELLQCESVSSVLSGLLGGSSSASFLGPKP